MKGALSLVAILMSVSSYALTNNVGEEIDRCDIVHYSQIKYKYDSDGNIHYYKAAPVRAVVSTVYANGTLALTAPRGSTNTSKGIGSDYFAIASAEEAKDVLLIYKAEKNDCQIIGGIPYSH